MIHRRSPHLSPHLSLPALLLIGLLLQAGCHGSAASVARSTSDFPAGTGFVKHEVVVDGAMHQVWVFIPKNYRPENRCPSILFLHGLFEAGKDDGGAITAGLGPVIARSPQTWPFITIFPQSTGTWRGDDRERLAMAALDSVQANWSVDGDRVTLAGLSYGGLGVWEIGARHPDRFAALVPVASPGDRDAIDRLLLLPVWAFNYRADLVVSSARSDEMCREITSHGGNAKQTCFAGIGHDCWNRAVAESDVVDWMLQQRISARSHPNADTSAVADVR
jgi:predicted peptidase